MAGPALGDKADEYLASGRTNDSKCVSADANCRHAVADFTRAIELRPDFAEAYYGRGSARVKGLPSNQRLVGSPPKVQPANASVLKAIDDGIAAAIEDFNKALRLKPDYAEAYRGRGHAIGRKYHNSATHDQRDLDNAIADFSKAIQLDPAHLEGADYRSRAKLLVDKGEYEEAIRDYSKSIKLAKRETLIHVYYDRGSARRSIGDFCGAAADFTNGFEISGRLGYADPLNQKALADAESAGGRPGCGRIRLLVRGAAGAKLADAFLVLDVSWSFSGREGGIVEPNAELSMIIGASGIADTASGPIQLPFSTLYKKASEPLRIYFKVAKGDLDLWRSADAAPATGERYQIQLSPAWLAASTELPAMPDHPAGGVSVSSHPTSGEPLEFFIDFAGGADLKPPIKGMGIQ
jgi:tetratricopeptide (TPR) repeat protein